MKDSFFRPLYSPLMKKGFFYVKNYLIIYINLIKYKIMNLVDS